MAVRGIFTSHSNIVGDRVGDFAARVLMYMPQGSAPLLALSSGMQKKPARDQAFSWIEDDHISGATEAAETVNAAATDFDVDDANLWVPNTILLNVATGERMLVTAITGNNVTVVRGIAGTTADDVTVDDAIHNIGTAFGEGSGKPTPISQRGASRTNYVQIFKNGWAITGTAQAIDWHTGNQLATNRSQCAGYHAEDIEKAFLFGKKGYLQVSNQTVFLSDGVFEQVESYGGVVELAAYNAQAGEMSMAGIMDFMRRIFLTNVQGAPNERIAFTSSQTLLYINHMARMDSTYNLEQVPGDTWGMTVIRIKGINGDLKLLTHPLFDHLGYHHLLVLHPQFITKRELRPMESHEFTRAKANNSGTDADEGFLLSHLGFEVGGTKTMGVMKNIDTPVHSFTLAPAAA